MNAEAYIPALAILAVISREMLWISAIAIAVSGLDDLMVDCLWLFGVAARRPEALPPPPAQAGWFAILVPAWDEAAVIGPMLTRLLASQRHPRFHLFVGVYPNDPATIAAVRAIRDDRLVVVITARAGPTTKADCLNALWAGALQHEQALNIRYKAVVLHDAEDVVHPQSLAVYDRWMPGLAMVQLPVIPFPDPCSRWISGHYIDEFAENHSKDMAVRDLLGAPVPSAGVGTAIDRAILAELARHGEPFDATSLTEDYELGHKIHALGGKGRLVQHRIDGETVATREFFPATLEAAVRQKSRWQTGIALSGWDRIGWQGNFARRWMLWRDRKGPVTATLTIIGYATMLLLAVQAMVRAMLELPAGFAPSVIAGPQAPMLHLLLVLNAALLCWRLLLRAWFTSRVHGVGEGLRAVVRAVVANLINFLATLRALERYRDALDGGGQPWEKTAHRFPAPAGTAMGAGHG